MRIVYDVSSLSHRRTGVGNYVRGCLAGMAEVAGAEHELLAFAPVSERGAAEIADALEGIDVERRLPLLPYAHAWRRAWSRVGRPPAERYLGPFDVLHFGDWMHPPQRRGVRATTVHDLVPLRFPQWVHPVTRALHLSAARALQACDVVFANSEHTAADVATLLGYARERIHVVYPGVEPSFAPEGDRADLGRPYVFTVATLEPRKNLDTLADAFRLVKEDVVLAVAGGAGWGPQPALDDERIVRLGYVPNAELPRWYRGAVLSVYPSRFEGFGMPVVESMACGTPCVASSHPSIDEAAGAVAVRADPDDAEALAAAIDDALARRDELVEPGLEHARPFTWRAAGEAMLRGYAVAAA